MINDASIKGFLTSLCAINYTPGCLITKNTLAKDQCWIGLLNDVVDNGDGTYTFTEVEIGKDDYERVPLNLLSLKPGQTVIIMTNKTTSGNDLKPEDIETPDTNKTYGYWYKTLIEKVTDYQNIIPTMPLAILPTKEEGFKYKDASMENSNAHSGAVSFPLLSYKDNEGTIYNNQTIYFPECFNEEGTGDWGTIKYFGLFAKETGEDPYLWGQITTKDEGGNVTATEVDVTQGSIPIFRAEQFSISLTEAEV